MSAAYQTALAALASIRARLADVSLSAGERAQALAEFDAVLEALKRSDHRLSTEQQARRVQDLDRQLADRPVAERNQIIRDRIGISRTRLYELRRVPLNPDGRAI